MEHPPTTAHGDELAWYCVRSQRKHERIAATHLRKVANVEVFAPMLRYQRARRQGGKTWVTEAMFPSYLFVRFHLTTRFDEIRYSHGVRGIVRFGERCPAVPAALIHRLRESASDDETIVIAPSPEPGREATITEGAFTGMQVLITQYFPAKERVLVLLTMLGREMVVEIPSANVATGKPAYPLA